MNFVKTILKIFAACIVLFLIAGFVYFIQYIKPFKEQMAKTMLVNFDMNLMVVQGGGGNSGILLLDSMVLVIDSKMDEAAKELYETAKKISDNKPIVLVNTHYHPDHTGGNDLYSGQTIIAGGNYSLQQWKNETGSAILPTIWVKDSLIIETKSEKISILNMPSAAHTESDLVVYLHNKKVLFTGDLILNKQVPMIMGAGNTSGYLSALDYLRNRYPFATVVPGHGNMGSRKVFDTFSQYMLDMKEAAENSEKKDELISKYSDWTQLPFFMSHQATIRKFKL